MSLFQALLVDYDGYTYTALPRTNYIEWRCRGRTKSMYSLEGCNCVIHEKHEIFTKKFEHKCQLNSKVHLVKHISNVSATDLQNEEDSAETELNTSENSGTVTKVLSRSNITHVDCSPTAHEVDGATVYISYLEEDLDSSSYVSVQDSGYNIEETIALNDTFGNLDHSYLK